MDYELNAADVTERIRARDMDFRVQHLPVPVAHRNRRSFSHGSRLGAQLLEIEQILWTARRALHRDEIVT
jgi:hypothetical protein